MTAEVVPLFAHQITDEGVPVSAVCAKAAEVCEEVVVIGYIKGTGKLYAGASFGLHGAERTVWMMEKAKAWLLDGTPDQDGS